MDMAGRISADGGGTDDPCRTDKVEAFDLDFQMQNIFSAAELEAGDAEPAVETVDVPAVIRDAVSAFARHARDRSLDIRLDGDPAGAAVFETDGRKLRQIVPELPFNAVTFSPFRADWSRFHVDDDTLSLSVEDQGPGIPAESRDAVVRRFRQLDSENDMRRKGRGLGLSVVRPSRSPGGANPAGSGFSSGGARFTVVVPEPSGAPGTTATCPLTGRPLTTISKKNDMIQASMDIPKFSVPLHDLRPPRAHLVHTLLGSCVSVCLWDQKRACRGMNHYMLPLWNGEGLATPRYGNIAIENLLEKDVSFGLQQKDLVAKVFEGIGWPWGMEGFSVWESGISSSPWST